MLYVEVHQVERIHLLVLPSPKKGEAPARRACLLIRGAHQRSAFSHITPCKMNSRIPSSVPGLSESTGETQSVLADTLLVQEEINGATAQEADLAAGNARLEGEVKRLAREIRQLLEALERANQTSKKSGASTDTARGLGSTSSNA